MANCDRCGRYVSTDYIRVFGDNRNRLDACPGCRATPIEDETSDGRGDEDRTLRFRMSEFEAEEGTNEGEGDRSASADTDADSGTANGTRLGRLGSAVSDLF
jgi:hypothetical protein